MNNQVSIKDSAEIVQSFFVLKERAPYVLKIQGLYITTDPPTFVYTTEIFSRNGVAKHDPDRNIGSPQLAILTNANIIGVYISIPNVRKDGHHLTSRRID